MKCVRCRKETDSYVKFELEDIVIVPICNSCKQKTPDGVIKLTAMSRQIREKL